MWKRLYIQLSAEEPHEHPPQHKALRVQVKVLTIRILISPFSLLGRDVIWRTLTRVIGEMFTQTFINQYAFQYSNMVVPLVQIYLPALNSFSPEISTKGECMGQEAAPQEENYKQ